MQREAIGLTVVGPDDALAAGIVDAFEHEGLRIFGPTPRQRDLSPRRFSPRISCAVTGFQLRRRKSFRKVSTRTRGAARAKYPLVVKADGLALGKGVVVAENPLEAAMAIHRAMDQGVFGEAGRRVVIEECLRGVECSLHALVDGSGYCLFPDARDHKRAFDGNRGPNTGGMGTISPSGALDASLIERIREEVLDRFVAGIKTDGIAFRGMLFPGLMLTGDGPKVLEFNCRFRRPGDAGARPPAAQRFIEPSGGMRGGDACRSAARMGWAGSRLRGSRFGRVSGRLREGQADRGIGGRSGDEGGCCIPCGNEAGRSADLHQRGRVLGVTAMGADLGAARELAYRAADTIRFDQIQRREDIGAS